MWFAKSHLAMLKREISIWIYMYVVILSQCRYALFPDYLRILLICYSQSKQLGIVQCHRCGRHFGNATRLKNHMVTHTGAKDFQCDICKRLFSLKHKLKQHILVVHVSMKSLLLRTDFCFVNDFHSPPHNRCRKNHLHVGNVEKHLLQKVLLICFKHVFS